MMYEIAYSKKAKDDLQRHKKSGDKVVQKKITKLLKELEKHPRSGTGKPEQLKHKEVETWSRRINDKHRMVYEIEDNIITVDVLSFWGHYEDK